MLQNKNTRIISEIQVFFTTSEKALNAILLVINSLRLPGNLLPDKVNTFYPGKNKLLLLLLFPLFEIKDASRYAESTLFKLFGCGKDLFYRFLNDSTIDWRAVLYHINLKLIRKIEKECNDDNKDIKCLIVDDTDFPKTGIRTELIGRVFSHVIQKSIVGFKGLFLCYHDGKSLYALDYSLHGEKGKNKKKPFGLTKKQANERYKKKRSKSSAGQLRIDEYNQSKISNMIYMIRRAIQKGIRFDYLLVDSWFTCRELVGFIKSRRIKCHLLGMIRMGTTKYEYNGKLRTSKEIAEELRKKRKVKSCKLFNCRYSEAIVNFQGAEVKLFFCKYSRKGKWSGLLTTNTDLNFKDAYATYSTRWTIEVYNKECKQYLGLVKCQSQDFDAQIAHTAICMLQHNLLSVVKRLNAYETLGELFRETQANTLELTIKERILKIIIEIVSDLAEILEVEVDMLMEKILSENENLANLLNCKPLFKAS